MLEGWWSQWPFSAVIREHNFWSPGFHWGISCLGRQDTRRANLQARFKVNIYTVYLMVSRSILSIVTLPGHEVKIQAVCSTAHSALAAQRQHQGTLSAFLEASGSAARQGHCCPSSLDGCAGYKKMLRLLIRWGSQLCPAEHQCLPWAQAVGLLTCHVDAKGNQMVGSTANISCVVIQNSEIKPVQDNFQLVFEMQYWSSRQLSFSGMALKENESQSSYSYIIYFKILISNSRLAGYT